MRPLDLAQHLTETPKSYIGFQTFALYFNKKTGSPRA